MGNADTFPTTEQLALLEDVIGQVARAGRLPEQDEEDFTQSVHVKLLERNYDIFRRFEGRSSLRTYLMVVVKRMLLDWRNALYGKWRPSAAAVRLGEHAIRLERLIHRDQFTVPEAVEVVRRLTGAPTAEGLLDLAARLPGRIRRYHVSPEHIADAPTVPFDDPIDAAEQRLIRSRAHTAVARALRLLPAEDRRLVALRYRHGHSVRTIARSLELEPKALYRRYERVLKGLGRSVGGDTGVRAVLAPVREARGRFHRRRVDPPNRRSYREGTRNVRARDTSCAGD